MGLGMLRAFAQAGADVAVMGRDIDRCNFGVAAARELGVKAFAVHADVRKEAEVANAFDKAEKMLGPVSILANNAGANFPILAEKMSPNAWRAIVQIALDGTFLCSAEFARRRVAKALPGVIVNNSAQYVWSGFPGDAHSAAAKSAIVGLTTALGREWAPYGIRVNCIAAGFFPHASMTAHSHEGLDKMIPAGRVGRMQEFGWLAAFVCSPFARAVTGQTLVIDGGDRLMRVLMSPEFTEPRDREALWGTPP
jgi:NAD(P)-dependent dehydrogenase (short-subunit alcohol dehydrogenase family)